MNDPRDALILSLCDKLYICSRLLTRAAERLGWDTPQVEELVQQLRDTLPSPPTEEVEKRAGI